MDFSFRASDVSFSESSYLDVMVLGLALLILGSAEG